MKTNYLKIGEGIIELVEETLSLNNISGKVLYVSDPYVDQLYGDSVKTQIEKVANLKEEYIEQNTIKYAMEIAERCIATDINCIVGLGGGKTLDVCKYASHISKIQYLAIPTTASNDGLVSPVAVLKRQDGMPKSLGATMPSMSLIDTTIIANGPLKNIKAGIGDTISNYMALRDWEFAVSKNKDEMNTYAYLISKNSLDVLMNSTFDKICPEFIDVLVNSLVMSGLAMEFAGSSRPVSGSEHCFSHALDLYAPVKNLHGFQVALGTVAMLKLLKMPYSDILEYLHRFDVQINPREMGIDKNTFMLCMKKGSLMRRGRYTYLDEADLSDKTIENLYWELLEEL